MDYILFSFYLSIYKDKYDGYEDFKKKGDYLFEVSYFCFEYLIKDINKLNFAAYLVIFVLIYTLFIVQIKVIVLYTL